MKKLLFILLFTSLSLLSWSNDTTRCTLSYHASVTAGYTLRDGKVDVYNPGPALGAKVAIDIRPGKFNQGLHDWNDATAGVALDYINMGNNEWLGSIIAPYTYLRIPLLRLPHFELGIRPGIGMAFSTKTYYNTIPDDKRYEYLYTMDKNANPVVLIANQCIGSVTNFYFAEALYMEFPIANGFGIVASGGWYHVSNGSTIQPNSGYNMLTGEVGLRYTPVDRREADEEVYQLEERKEGSYSETHRIGPRKLPYYGGWDFEASVSGGFRQVYYKDNKDNKLPFGVASISLAAHYRPWSIFKIGGGIDVFYDGAYTNRETKFGKTALNLATPADCWRLGISLQPEFVIGKFSAGFHFGVYLLDGVKNIEAEGLGTSKPSADAQTLQAGERLHKPIFYSYDLLRAGSAGHPDGWLYTRILMKYRVTDHFFLQLGMKAHLTKAEFVDAGVGFTFWE